MNIAMFTNAYEPVIGGLERSIATFVEDLRELGHRTLIVTLSFPGAEESSNDIFRLPAVKEVSGTQFSIKVPVPAGLSERLDQFEPEVIHSHHPFMLGDTALRVARKRALPILFTHHTLYERYAYLFSRESEVLERIARDIATEYANLCDLAVAPTESIKELIQDRGVTVPVEVIPTGVDLDTYSGGDREGFRTAWSIPNDCFVLGYLGRVVEAKNMDFLSDAVSRFLSASPEAWYLVVGDGESVEPMKETFERAGVGDRVVMTGSLEGEAVADAYAAMDLMAFASHTETQGIVLVEAFAAGVPVVALDASGSRDIIRDGTDGRVLDQDASPGEFAQELERLEADPEQLKRWSREARERSHVFDRRRCAERLAALYGRVKGRGEFAHNGEPVLWDALQNRFATEWDLFTQKLAVMAAAVTGGEEDEGGREKTQKTQRSLSL